MFVLFILLLLSTKFCQNNSWTPILKKGFYGMIGIKNICRRSGVEDKVVADATETQNSEFKDEIVCRRDGLVADSDDKVYKAFTKDGIIQGVFLDTDENGKQFVDTVQHIIRTEKTKWNINFPTNIWATFFYNFIRWITNNNINLLGTANTSLFLDNNNKLYALFERDLPYEILFDYKTRHISSGKRKKIDNIKYFSGHSKKRLDNNTMVVDSIEYDVSNKKVIHNIISSDLETVIRKTVYKSEYIPIVHDFYMLSNTIVWVDSPFSVCLNKDSEIKGYKYPIGLDPSKPTFFHVGDDIYTLHKSICIFHIAYAEETENYIDIYASIYEKLHFSENINNINGKYCCIRLYKKSQYAEILLNEKLEKYNLDFPIVYRRIKVADGDKVLNPDVDEGVAEDDIILRNIENNRMNGFIICNKLQIKKKIFFHNISLIGEAVIINDTNNDYLLFFTKNTKNNYLTKINLYNYEIEYLKLNTTFYIGFHSIWIE